MKKIIYLFAAMAIAGAAASCNENLGPEYTYTPQLSNFSVSPAVEPFVEPGASVEKVIEYQPVSFTGNFTNLYGTSNVYVVWRYAEAHELEDKSSSEISEIWLKKWRETSEAEAKNLQRLYTWEYAPVDAAPFSLSIPGYAEGTVVQYTFGYANSYNRGYDISFGNGGNPYEYTVVAAEPILPEE